MTARKVETLLFDGEGKEFLGSCIDAAVEYCQSQGIGKIVIFTATGEGPMHLVMNGYAPESGIRVVAVTPPVGKAYIANPLDPLKGRVLAGISEVTRRALDDYEIAIVSARLPFQSPPGAPGEHGFPSEWARVERAYGILGGGFSLCIQATMMACDAGHVSVGERIVAATSATAVSLFASSTDLFLSPTHGLMVDEWICRPAKYNISQAKNLRLEEMGHMRDPPPLQANPPRQLGPVGDEENH